MHAREHAAAAAAVVARATAAHRHHLLPQKAKVVMNLKGNGKRRKRGRILTPEKKFATLH